MRCRFAPLLIIITLFSYSAMAKNLEGRYGFGVSFQTITGPPGLSARYHFSPYASATFVIAFDTADLRGTTQIGVKIYRNAHREENINFYLGIGAFLISEKVSGTTNSGFEIDGLIGAEFFISGLPNLGLQFESGIAVRTAGDVTFQTIGSGFAGAGVHYYF